MSRFITMAVTAWVVVGLVSSRVLVDPPKQDRPSLDQLLQHSDPHENDIFSESVSRGMSAFPRGPPRPSPTQHLLESLSRPRYVDASEFRRLEVLPPALDINRQLTLLAASKRIRPPVDFIHPVLTEESSGTIYFPNTAPLFRENFPSQKIADEQDYLEKTSVVELITQRADEATEEPTISTSVSVSTSESYSNDSSTTLDIETSSDTSATDGPIAASFISTTLEAESSSHTTPPTPSTPPTLSTTTSTSSPSVVSQLTTGSDNASDTPRSSTQIVEAEIVLHPEGSDYPERSGRQLAYEVAADYPDYPDYSDYEAMSPLAHILGGLGSEFDSYGGDFGRSEFISSFRPDGF